MAEYGSIIEECRKYEFLIVVGAEDYYSRAANKMMFLAQAVRYVKLFASSFDITTVHYFRGTHTQAQIDAFEAAVKKYGGTATAVSSWAETAARVNSKQVTIDSKSYQKRVAVLLFVAHGAPHRIWLEDKKALYFTEESCKSIETSAFAAPGENSHGYTNVHITSWACQTGNGYPQGVDEDTRMAASLAQRAANIVRVPVYASPTRTSYSNTWATGLDGKVKDWTHVRTLIDGAVWQDAGADGPPYSSAESSLGNDGIKLHGGMYRFAPDQLGSYERRTLR